MASPANRGVPAINGAPKPFAELPKRKREFIKLYVRSGDSYDSYLKAGYKDTRNSRAAAGKLLRDLAPYLSDALTEYVDGVEMAILGTKVIRELAEQGSNEAVRLNAAKELKERMLANEPKEQVVRHKHEGLDNRSLDDRIADLTASLTKQGVLPNAG